MSTSTDTRVWAELGDWGNGPAWTRGAPTYAESRGRKYGNLAHRVDGSEVN